MKLTKRKRIILMMILSIFVLLLLNSNNTFAAINTSYASSTDVVSDSGLDKAIKDSTLISMLGKLMYAVGRFLEWILSNIFKMLTGSSDFPWADKIVFNAVPLLDINFMNPSVGSFVKNDGVQKVLKNLYSTIMTLAVGFFGIAVLITSIRLVLSTIASEKAKYKQTIVDWLVGFVMIFCIHYFISFVFYLNEQLVVVASKIITTQLAQADVEIAQAQIDEHVDKLIHAVEEKGTEYNGKKVATILKKNKKIVSAWLSLGADDKTTGIHEGLMKTKEPGAVIDSSKFEGEQYEALGMIISWAADENASISDLTKLKQNLKVARLLFAYNLAIETTQLKKIFKDYYEDFIKELGGVEAVYEATQLSENKLIVELNILGVLRKREQTFVGKGYYILSRGSSELGYKSGTFIENTSFWWTDVIDDLLVLKGASATSSGKKVEGSGTGVRLISNLADYFKTNASEKKSETKTGLKDGKNINLENCIMFAVLVAQSLILFIAYIKRLFYVIILAMMGPVVVVFDFFQKFGKGKGGGPLSTWIKEFTSLVFTQTIQAFIFTIVLSMILLGMSVSRVSDLASSDTNSALGIMSVFALLSVFKVEEMTKKIFGISDTKASHGAAMKSIAKTGMALKMGRRVLDNAGKVGGGIKNIHKARQDRRKLQSRFEEDMRDNGFDSSEDDSGGVSGGGSAGGASGGFDSSEDDSGGVSGGGSAGGASGGGNNAMSGAAYRRAKNALRNMEDKSAEINKARNEGWKNIASGILEYQGSVFGGAIGAVFGGADGNLDEALTGMIAGAGVGDATAQGALNIVTKTTNFIKDQGNVKKGVSNKELQQAINSYKDAIKNANVNYNSSRVDDIDI